MSLLFEFDMAKLFTPDAGIQIKAATYSCNCLTFCGILTTDCCFTRIAHFFNFILAGFAADLLLPKGCFEEN
jgi:hypothetical protein